MSRNGNGALDDTRDMIGSRDVRDGTSRSGTTARLERFYGTGATTWKRVRIGQTWRTFLVTVLRDGAHGSRATGTGLPDEARDREPRVRVYRDGARDTEPRVRVNRTGPMTESHGYGFTGTGVMDTGGKRPEPPYLHREIEGADASDRFFTGHDQIASR